MKTLVLSEKEITGMIGAIARARVAYASNGRLDLATTARRYEDILLSALASSDNSDSLD